MFTFISLILIISITLFFIFFKRNLIFKLIERNSYLKKNIPHKSNNQFLKSNLADKVQYQKEINICSNLEKYHLRKKMVQLFKGSKKDKLEALKIAKQLSDKSTLNVLRVGLKDMDSDIVKLSAKLIANFK